MSQKFKIAIRHFFVVALFVFVFMHNLCAETLPQIADLPIPENFGVNIHFENEQVSTHVDYIKRAGIGWVRRDIFWNIVESQKGVYDFSKYDHLIETLHDAGLHILLILDYGNPLYDGENSPISAEGRAAYAEYAAITAKHFQGKVDLWEIYNEPNDVFWRPKPDVDQYITMANEATAAIHHAVPDAAIAGPALTGPFNSDMFFGKFGHTYAFLDKVLASDAAHGWSAITVHPYRSKKETPETTAKQIENIRSLMRDHKIDPAIIPIIATEWGYSTYDDGLDEETQAAYAVRSFLFANIQRMPFSIWYDWQDDGNNEQEKEQHFGLLRAGTLWSGESQNKSMKPAYTAIQVLSTLLNGYRFQELIEKGPPVIVASFIKDSQMAYVAWSTDNEPHEIKIKLPDEQWNTTRLLDITKPLTVYADHNASITVDKMPIIVSSAGN